MSTELSNEENSRLEKLNKIKEFGIHPYPEKFDKKLMIKQCFDSEEGVKVMTAGRVIMFRDMGKLTFGHVQDESGRMQFAFEAG